MTQNERVLDYLKTNTSINQLEAWSELGIFRLGARIFELKKDGYEIESKMIEVKNRYGETCHVKEYRIK